MTFIIYGVIFALVLCMIAAIGMMVGHLCGWVSEKFDMMMWKIVLTTAGVAISMFIVYVVIKALL